MRILKGLLLQWPKRTAVTAYNHEIKIKLNKNVGYLEKKVKIINDEHG